jgi:hypothetical protein
MKVHLDIFKVQKEFAIEHGTRYVVRVHNFGTPNYRWFGAESLKRKLTNVVDFTPN